MVLLFTFHAYFFDSDVVLLLQAAPVNIVVGSHVWVEDPVVAWIDGEVIRINGHDVHVHTPNGKTVRAPILVCTAFCHVYE